LVSSFVSTGNSKGTEPYPIEEVMLNFRKIRIEYLEIGPDGRARGAIAGEVESSPTAAKYEHVTTISKDANPNSKVY
jgi:hypothetical protein